MSVVQFPDRGRRERVLTLLEFYRDVLEGLRERGPVCVGPPDVCGERDCRRLGVCVESDNVLAMMCEAYNHPSYRELERLLGVLRVREPLLWRALWQRFVGYVERRRARCAVCGDHPASAVGKVHRGCRRKGRTVTLRAVTVREFPPGFDAAAAERAVDWLVESWRGPVVVPPDVLQVVSERELRRLRGAA